MSEIKKLGFGLMRLPQKSANGADIDMEQFKKMVDLFLERGFTCFDTSYFSRCKGKRKHWRNQNVFV